MAVFLFISALNDDLIAKDESVLPQKSGSKRLNEMDLNAPGYRYPPLKKIAILDESLEASFFTLNLSKDSSVQIKINHSSKSFYLCPPVNENENPLQSSIANLMQLMTRIAGEGVINPQLAFVSYFVQSLIETISMSTKDIMKPLLSLIPPALVSCSPVILIQNQF